MRNYLEELNEQQKAAVIYTEGPQLVIAGAGSGKTRVLTYKIVHLISQGIDPGRIMALTFTNKAASEMKERISGIIGMPEAYKLKMGTFHSVFLRILRHHADRIGFKPTFTIYDATDSKSLVKLIIKDLGLDDKKYKPGTISSIISNAKNSLILPEMYLADKDMRDADTRAQRPRTGEIYKIYCNRCRTADAMDFDDILVFMNILLRDNPDILKLYSDFFEYILVDEYQDTNFAQNLIINTLAGTRKALCVVGDDAQSIYSFRGANIANILSMKNRWPDLEIFKLERNYRSTQTIVNAAGSLIEHNRGQIPKKVYSEKEAGDLIRVTEAFNDTEEGRLTADAISLKSLTTGDSFDNFAILYRTNSQSRIMEAALRERNIPYRIYGGITFYQRKEVKDALCYMRLAVNPDDDEALRRVINFPARGIGETTMKKLIGEALSQSVSIWEILKSPEKYPSSINAGTRNKLFKFRDLISEFIEANKSGCNAYELALTIYNRSGLSVLYAHDNTPEEVSKKENLNELLNGLNDFVLSRQEQGIEDLSMSAFLSQASLSTDQDDDDDSNNKVTLMTVHSAKGLEFKYVYIVGLEENLFPSALSLESQSEIEEERRLLYVAITRAESECNLFYAKSRFRNGETQAMLPSRFISEIDPQYMSSSGISYRISQNKYRDTNAATCRTWTFPDSPRQRQPEANVRKKTFLPDNNAGDYSRLSPSECLEGMKIAHQKFGIGVIQAIDKQGSDDLILVNFEHFGVKKLILKFAKLKVLY